MFTCKSVWKFAKKTRDNGPDQRWVTWHHPLSSLGFWRVADYNQNSLGVFALRDTAEAREPRNVVGSRALRG